MTATRRLHLVEPHPLEFDAEIVAVTSLGAAPSIVLRESAFFAEGGGQPGDRGALVIGGVRVGVVDVQLDQDGRVHHLLDGAPADAAAGQLARGVVDRVRRRDQRSQHSGQHVLSAALSVECGAQTVSSRLGAEESTIDVSAELSVEELARAVALANDVVLDDREIRVLFPTKDELASLGLRRDPKVESGVRVIDVDGFDRSPCGGTHCARTGEIGPIFATSVVRHRGGARISFVAGRRALDAHEAAARTLGSLARDFSCGHADVLDAVASRCRELEARTSQLAAARVELGRALAREALSRAGAARPAVAHVAVSHPDAPTLRAIAAELARAPGIAGVALGLDEARGEHAIVVERGDVEALDAGAWLKAFTRARGGRGGGRPERAEGRLAGGVEPTEVARAIAEHAKIV